MANLHNVNDVNQLNHVATYDGFKSIVTNAHKLDGNVIIGENGQAMKVDYGWWSKTIFSSEKAVARRKAQPAESQHARESLFKAIKANQHHLNELRMGNNLPRIDLREVADELGVVLDGQMNVLEGRATSDALSRLELSNLLDNLEGASTASQAKSAERTLKICGAHVSEDQIKTMLERVQNLMLENLGHSGLTKSAVKGHVQKYLNDLNGSSNRNWKASDRLTSLFKYVKGDIFGANRKRVNLSLESVAERFTAEIRAQNPAQREQGPVNVDAARKAELDQQQKLFSKDMDPYGSTGAGGARRGDDLLSGRQKQLIENYKGLPVADKDVIKIAPPNANEAGGVLNAAQAATDADQVRAFFADLILNEDVSQAVEDGIGNDTDRLKNVVRKHMVAFRLLCASLGNNQEEALFAQLKNVVGEDFTKAFKSILSRIDVQADEETVVSNFGALAQWARLEDMIDVGLSRNLFQKGWSGCMERADVSLDFEITVKGLGFFEDESDEGQLEEDLKAQPSDADDLRIRTLRLVNLLSGDFGDDSDNPRAGNGQTRHSKIMDAIKALKSVKDGAQMLSKIAKQMFAQAVAANCGLLGGAVQDNKKLGANEKMLLARITESLGSMSDTKMRKMFAAWLRSSKGLTAPGGELLKGADPSIIKLLQGCKPPKPGNGETKLTVDEEHFRDTLLSVTSKMPEMSENELKASLYPVYTELSKKMKDNGNTLTEIKVDKVLGSASVAQAMKCTLTYKNANAKTQTKTVIIKLIKGDSEQIFKNEKASIAKSLNSQNQSENNKLKAPTVSFVRSVTEEFDLKRELINMLQGLATYGASTEGKKFEVKFTPMDGLTHTVSTDKHISSVKPVFKEGVNESTLIEKIQTAREEASNLTFDEVTDETVRAARRQEEFEKKLLEIAEDNCLLCMSNCIIMEDAGASPLDDTLKEMTKQIEDENKEHPVKEDKDNREKLLKMKSSLLELSSEMSRGLFSGSLHMFHGDFNGGNLMYNPSDNTIKIIDYGKGMSLSSEEAKAIKKMFTQLTTGFQRGNETEVIDAYKNVIAAEIERVKLQKPGDDDVDKDLQEKELAVLQATSDELKTDDGLKALKDKVRKSVLRKRQTDLTTLGKIGSGRTGNCKDASEVMEDFRNCLEELGLATPLPLFDFFGSMGKIAKSLSVIDAELAILNERLRTSDEKETKINELNSIIQRMQEMQEGQKFNVNVKLNNTIQFNDVTLQKGDQSIYSGPLTGVGVAPFSPKENDEKAALELRFNVLRNDLGKKNLDDYALDVKSLGSYQMPSEDEYRDVVRTNITDALEKKEQAIKNAAQNVNYALNRAALVVYMTAAKQYELYGKRHDELEKAIKSYTRQVTEETARLMRKQTVTVNNDTKDADPDRIAALKNEIESARITFRETGERAGEAENLNTLIKLQDELVKLLEVQTACRAQAIKTIKTKLNKNTSVDQTVKAVVADILDRQTDSKGWQATANKYAKDLETQQEEFLRKLENPGIQYASLQNDRTVLLTDLLNQKDWLALEEQSLNDTIKASICEKIDAELAKNTKLENLPLLKWEGVLAIMNGFTSSMDLRSWVMRYRLKTAGTLRDRNEKTDNDKPDDKKPDYQFNMFFWFHETSPVLNDDIFKELTSNLVEDQSAKFINSCVGKYWEGYDESLKVLRTPFDFSGENAGGTLLPGRFYNEKAKEVAKCLAIGLTSLGKNEQDKVQNWFNQQPKEIRDYARGMRDAMLKKLIEDAKKNYETICNAGIEAGVLVRVGDQIKQEEDPSGVENMSLDERRTLDRFATAKKDLETLEKLDKEGKKSEGDKADEVILRATLNILLKLDDQTQELSDEVSVMSHELSTENSTALESKVGVSMAQQIQERYAKGLKESDLKVLDQLGVPSENRETVRKNLVDEFLEVIKEIDYSKPVEFGGDLDNSDSVKQKKSRILELQAIERSIRAELRRQNITMIDETDLAKQVRKAWAEHFASVYITAHDNPNRCDDIKNGKDFNVSDLTQTIGIVAYEEELKANEQRQKLAKAIAGK